MATKKVADTSVISIPALKLKNITLKIVGDSPFIAIDELAEKLSENEGAGGGKNVSE